MKKLNEKKIDRIIHRYVAMMITMFVITLMILDRLAPVDMFTCMVSMIICSVGIALGFARCEYLANLPKKSRRE